MTALPMMVNPQILVQSKDILTEDILWEEVKKIDTANKSYFQNAAREIEFKENQKIHLENIALTLQVEQIDYDKIDEVIDPELRKTCKDIRLKKSAENLDELLSSFKVDSSQLA
jgi:hypothetical protein